MINDQYTMTKDTSGGDAANEALPGIREASKSTTFYAVGCFVYIFEGSDKVHQTSFELQIGLPPLPDRPRIIRGIDTEVDFRFRGEDLLLIPMALDRSAD